MQLNPNRTYTIGPTLIASLPYSDFAASTTYYPYFPQSLHRNALHRTILVWNTLNESISGAIGFYPYDSTIASQPTGVAAGFSWGSGVGTNSMFNVNDQLSSAGNAGSLIAAVDSFQGGYPMGSTAPTSGTLNVYVTEVF